MSWATLPTEKSDPNKKGSRGECGPWIGHQALIGGWSNMHWRLANWHPLLVIPFPRSSWLHWTFSLLCCWVIVGVDGACVGSTWFNCALVPRYSFDDFFFDFRAATLDYARWAFRWIVGGRSAEGSSSGCWLMFDEIIRGLKWGEDGWRVDRS